MDALKIPATEAAPLIRTDFSDDAAWQALVDAMSAPQGDFQANLTPVDDPAFAGLTPAQAAAATDQPFVFLADAEAVSGPARAVLVVDVAGEPGRSFRAVPEQAWSVENNLSLANLDFADFLGALDAEGVYRGFPA